MQTHLSDNMSTRDGFAKNVQNKPLRTQIIGGYDPFVDKFGRTQFGTVVFEKENMIVLGGSLFILEKVFGHRMRNSSNVVVSVPTIDNLIPDENYKIAYRETVFGDKYTSDADYNASNTVCLFGLGIGGSDETLSGVADVHYQDANVSQMIPLREVEKDEYISNDNHAKYWCRCAPEGFDYIRYYLKSIEGYSIKSLWKDSDNEAEGSEVSVDTVNTSSNYITPIETFIELTLNITRDDINEYFNHNANTEIARINSIGLFTGIKRPLATPIVVTDGYQRTEEYWDIKLFSKLNVNNEVFELPKDLTIIYRIFTS